MSRRYSILTRAIRRIEENEKDYRRYQQLAWRVPARLVVTFNPTPCEKRMREEENEKERARTKRRN